MFGSQTEIVNFSLYSLIPIVLIMYYVYRRDRFPEPPRVVLITFLLGVATIFPISILIPVVEGFAENLDLSGESIYFYQAFIRAAFLEETAKWLVLILFCVKAVEFDEPMDALVYGVAVSLGFAAFENWEYIMSAAYDDELAIASEIAWGRAFTAVPLHALAGVFMGFFLIKAIFNSAYKKINIFLSLFFPICLHGFYNEILMSPNFSSWWIYPLLIVMFIRAMFVFRKERSKQEQKLFESEIKTNQITTSNMILSITVSLMILLIIVFLLNID